MLREDTASHCPQKKLWYVTIQSMYVSKINDRLNIIYCSVAERHSSKHHDKEAYIQRTTAGIMGKSDYFKGTVNPKSITD